MAEHTVRRMRPEIRIPADFEPHRTIVAWAVHREWGTDVGRVERELDTVIRTVAEYEPVTLLTPPDLVGAARARRFGPEIEIVPAPVDDIWMRDIAPVFGKRGKQVIAIDFNFNGWDNSRRGRAGDRLARTYDFGVPIISMPFVGEGGAFVTNGKGVAVATRSCLLSRNPHADEKSIAAAFARIGFHDLIWIDGDRREPITTGHPDGVLAFTPDGNLIVEEPRAGTGVRGRRRDIATLRRALGDGRAKRLLLAPGPPECADPGVAATYVNLYPVRRAVLTARFGNKANDKRAENLLRKHYPGREIRKLSIDTIASGGGIRCLTQPVPI
jgi:agmatine deiminase